MAFTDRLHNRGSISTGYDIDNSLKLEADNSEYLKANNSFSYTTPTSLKTGTFSCWVKRTELGTNYLISSANSARYSRLYFNSSDQIQLYSGDSSWNSVQPITNAVFRDTSAWYHIVLRLDSTDSTAANRLRLYINGEEQTWSTSPNITQDGVLTLCAIGSPTWHGYGAEYTYFTPSNFFSGYLAEVHYVDGQSLAPTEFGETDDDSGIWKPKKYNGTYGNCGYYLDFEDASNLGDDESGNGFDFDENNIAAADQATDTPTNNFCIMNPNSRTNGNIKTQEGGTKVTTDGGSGWCSMNATMGVQNGKWYWEMRFENAPGDTNTVFIGIAGASDTYIPHKQGGYYLGNVAATNSIGWYFVNGAVYNGNGAWTGPNYGDIAMVALDMDNGKLYFGVNGTWGNSSNPANNTNGIPIGSFFGVRWPDFVLPSVSVYQGKRINSMNFGGYKTYSNASTVNDDNGYGTFEYAPPSGYYALCTKNLAEYG